MSITTPAIKTPETHLPIWRQLRWNLIFYFVLAAVAPLAIVQYFTLTQTSNQAQKQSLNQLESVSELKINEIHQWFDDSYRLLRTFIDPDKTIAIVDLLQASTEDKQAAVSQRLAAGLQNTAGTSSIRDVPPLFDKVFIYDMTGKVLASSDDTDLGKILSRQPFFPDSLTETHIQPPYYALNTGKLTVVMTEPIRDQNGIVGVLGGEINVTILSSIMAERSGLGTTGETYLVSDENNYLLTPSRFEGYSTNRAYHSEGIDKALQSQTGSGIYPAYRGTNVLGYYRWVPELQAGLLAEQDEVEALAATQSVVNTGVVVAIISALAAIILGSILLSQISNPLLKLTQVTTDIANGKLDLRADLKQNNEIGLLANAFNQMTDRLGQTLEGLRSHVEELEKAKVEREKLIKDLQAAKRLAEENSRLKSEFLSTMSHELRTPLNAIEGFTGIILNKIGGTDYNPKTEGYLTRIRSNSKRLLQLINDFLDLSRVEAGRLELANQPFSPFQLAKRWQDEIGVLADKKGIQFEVSLDSSLPETVYGDEEAISKVVINMLSNAIKFTEQGQVKLALERHNGNWGITVEDTGIGIPPHAREVIFEEFRQVDQSSKRKYGGTGLGLAIAQKYTRAMGGTVNVKSDLGKGSTFTVSLPLKTSHDGA